MSLKNNILKNGLATGLQKIIRILEQLLLVPFFISSWGAEYYGEWLTLTIIPSMIALSDLGFGTSAANKFLLKYASGNKQEAANTAKSGFFLISVVVASSLSLSVLVIFLLNLIGVFDKLIIDKYDAIWSILCMMFARIITFYNQFYEAFFRAARKASLSINLQSIYSFSNIILGLLVLLSGGGVVLYSITTLVISILFNPYYGFRARKLLGLYKTHKGVLQRHEINSIMKNGLGYLLSPIWQAIYFQGTTFVIRLTIGPIAVAIFNTVRTLIRSVNQVFNLITLSVFPEFQFEIGAGHLKKAKKIFAYSLVLTMTSAIVGVLFLYFFGLGFYELWTHKSLNPPVLVWNILIIGVLFNATWWVATIVFQAYNKPYSFTLPSTISACISLITTYLLSTNFGLIGTAIGVNTLDIILAFYLLPKGCMLLGISFNEIINFTYNQIWDKLFIIKNKIVKNEN